MNIRKIKGFCMAARCGSFSKAAESIFMTQPSFSRMISSMEEELGCTLFERSRIETVLTPVGKQILPEMEAILESYEKAAHIASEYKPQSKGTIVIGEFPLGWTDHTRRICARWNGLDNGAPIRTQEVSGATAFKALRSGEIDFVHTLYTPAKYQPFLAAVPADAMRHCAFVSECHRLAGKKEISIRELKGEHFIFFDRSHFPLMFERVSSACANEGFIPDVLYETDNSALMMNRVSTGEGVAVIPDFIGHRPAGVVAVPIAEIPEERSYWFWWKENTRPEVLQFAEYLAEEYGQEPAK